MLLTILKSYEARAMDHAYNISNMDYSIANNNVNTINQQSEKNEVESPLRRFEITFIISLPFVFLANFLFFHIADVIILKDPNVNVWENHGPFLALNTVMITSIVSYREARINSDINQGKINMNMEKKINISYTINY